MSQAPSPCPSRDVLESFHLGRLPENEAPTVLAHVSDCPTCQEALGTMRAGVDPYAQEAECQAVGASSAAAGSLSEPTVAYAGQAAFRSSDPAGLGHLGVYELLEKLGEGGMGAVYKARHTRLDKIVALKVLPPQRMSDPQAVARFEREMKAVGRVDHPNIVRAMDADESNGTYYLVMEYVAGLDLGDVLQHGGELPFADACELVRQMAAGLQCAHENGLVHRDLKPTNAILTPKGQVKILDLGLARLSSGPEPTEAARGEMTSSGTAMGTADYMAPEQAQDSHTADIRADIYSLGCTLYKLLTGKSPFSGPQYKTNLEKIMGHLRDTPTPLGSLRNDVPADFAAVLDRMLAKDRGARYATPQEVVDALQPFTTGAHLPRLYRQADARKRGEPVPDQSVTGTEPGVPSASSDTARQVQLLKEAIASPLLAPEPPASRPPLPPAVLIALGLLGVLILAGVIIVRIRHKDGSETVLTLPDTAQVDVIREPDTSPSLPVGQWVPLVKSEEDLKAWQKTGPGTVTYENGTVRVQNAAVTYPTVAIDLVIRVQIQVEVNVKPTAKLLLRETPAGSYAAKLEDGSKLVLGVTEGGKWRELKSAPVTVAADQPLALEFSAVGNVLTVSLNGKPAIEVKDSTHSYGSPGLAATDGATVFRDVDVKVVRPKEVDLAKMTERPQAHKAATSPPSVPATPSVAKNGDKPPHSKMAFPIGVWVPVLRSEEDLAEWKGHSAAQATYTAEGMELDSATHEAVVAYPDSRPDTAIRARVKKISGQNLSLWLRSSPAGYSAAWFNSGNDFGVGVRVAGQPFRDLARVKTAESFSDFFDFEFATVGNQLLVFVNGCLVIKADDPSVVQGMPGIVANLGKSLFQDVQIKVLTSRDGKAEKLARGEQDRLVAELEAEHLPPWNLAKGSPPPAIAPFDAKQARAHQEAWAKHLGVAVETTNSIGMKLVLIPPGEYEMGLTTEEMEAAKQDVAKAAPALAGYFARTLPLATPKHRVRVPRPFQLGACEVTQEQFQRFVKETGYRPINHAPPLGNKCWTLFPDTAWVRGSPVSWRGAAERSQDSSEPVVDVSAMDAQAFCDWLSQKEQADYRIPTEEEWEFACRAGGAGRFGFAKDGSDVAKYGWTDEPGTVSDPHPIDRPHAIGQKLPNPFGLYDTLGNAHEVCLSSFYPNQTAIPAGYPCLRGGERRLPAAGGPPVHRIPLHPFEFVQGVQGFRIVRETPMSLPAPPEDPTAAERWVANWLLERRAELTIRSGGKSQVVSSPGSVPAGTVQVESVTFGPMARFEPAELTYLQRLPSLSVLKLDNFRIEDRAAARLVGLNKLTELRISSWRVYHSLAYLAKNESIRKVAFDNCTPDDRTLVQLGAIKNLEELTLIGHAFTTDGLRHLAGLQKLRRLVLSGTAIGDAGLKHLGGLKSLTELNLASTRVTDAGLAHLAGCEALEILDLSKTAVTGTGLAPLARLRRLVTLKLDSTKLTDEGCAALGRLTSLRTLNLHQTSLSDAGFKHLESLQDLRELNVCWTTISDAGLVSIGKLRRLTKLEMWQTVVSDLGVEPLRGLTDLQELILGWTRVGDKAADICSRFPNLQKLILQGTCVTDACTEGLGLLKTGKLISMLNTNVSPGRLSGLKAQLPSCKIEPDVFVEYSRDRNPVDVATYVTTKASAKVRLGNGETQVVTGRQWSTRVAAPFHVVELCAEDSPIGDAMLNDVRFLKSITLLNLKNARITNRGVQDLVGLKTLETLILDANPIDDSALSHLYGLTALRLLSLRATRVTPAGVQALMDKLPQCRVESDFLVTRTGGPLFAQSPATQPAPIAGLRSWAVLPAAPRDFVSAIACSPAAGNLIALAGDEGDRSPATVRMWGWAAEKKPAEKKPGVSESGGASVLLGHTKKVQALAWSPDGKYLASAGQDVTVKVWEPATDRCLRTIQLTGPATALAWSPTMDRLAVACDASVGLITLKGGELREVADAAVKGGLAWSPDGARFVIGSGDKSTFTLTVYDAATFTAERAITSEELAGRSATWSPDGKRLAAALGDRIIRMWDFETLQRVRDLTAPAGSVGLIAWSPKGDRLASAGKQLIVWDAEKGTQLASCPLESGAPLGLSWTADGEHVAVQSTKDVGVHAAADGTLVDTLSVTGPIPATKLKIQPDGHYRAVGPIAEHLVYVALTDDYRQESYTPAAFAAKFGWKNEP